MKNRFFLLKLGGGDSSGEKPKSVFLLVFWAALQRSMKYHFETTCFHVWIFQFLLAGKEGKIDVFSTESFSITWVYHAQINLLSHVIHFGCRRKIQEFWGIIKNYSSNMQLPSRFVRDRFTWNGVEELKKQSLFSTRHLPMYNIFLMFKSFTHE